MTSTLEDRPWLIVRLAAVVIAMGMVAVLALHWLNPSASGIGGPAPDEFTPQQQVVDAGGWTSEFTAAWDAATGEAAAAGVELRVTSGYRTSAQQQELWDSALTDAGSEAGARRTALPPTESAHVGGTAVDVDRPSATWLEAHGWRYGLCFPYANEWWHVELTGEPGEACPPQQATPAG